MITCPLSFAVGPFILDIEKFLCHWITMAYKSLDTSAGWGTEYRERKNTPRYSLTPLKTNHCPSGVKGIQCNQHTTKHPVALLEGWCYSRGLRIQLCCRKVEPSAAAQCCQPREKKAQAADLRHDFHAYHQSTHLRAPAIDSLMAEAGWHELRLSHSGCSLPLPWWMLTDGHQRSSQRAPFVPSPLCPSMTSCSQSKYFHSRPLTNHPSHHEYLWVYGCFVCVCVCVHAHLCLILCDPMNCYPPGSSLHEIS